MFFINLALDRFLIWGFEVIRVLIKIARQITFCLFLFVFEII